MAELINAACRNIADVPCYDLIAEVQAIAGLVQEITTNGGPNEYEGAFRVADGFEICRAYVNTGTGSMTGHATFTAGLQNGKRQLGYYAFVRGGQSRDWIDFNIYLDIIPSSDPRPDNCMNDNEQVAYCGEKTPAGSKNCGGAGIVSFNDANQDGSNVPTVGVLTAFSNYRNQSDRYGIISSPDGAHLGDANNQRYEGASPVIQMIPYKDGVLTAFSSCGAKWSDKYCLANP